MPQEHSVTTCRWARPTLFLPWPHWCDAAVDEWSCSVGGTPRVLTDPRECHTCVLWEAQEPEHAAPAPELIEECR